jgi:Zn-dependent M28 family amino/carboxypeptidase
LLEIARAFRALPEPPRRSIIFLAVTGEERGLRGSDFFATHPLVPREQIVANINMDMFLMLSPLERVVALGAEHSSLGNAVKRASERLGIVVVSDPTPEEVSFVRSDQYSFVRRGIPAIALKGGFERGSDEAARTRQWLRTIYHTPKDDLSQNFRFDAGATFAQLNFLIGYFVAMDEARPAWNEGDFFGKTFGVQGSKFKVQRSSP